MHLCPYKRVPCYIVKFFTNCKVSHLKQVRQFICTINLYLKDHYVVILAVIILCKDKESLFRDKGDHAFNS